jgi:hypothetical protein
VGTASEELGYLSIPRARMWFFCFLLLLLLLLFLLSLFFDARELKLEVILDSRQGSGKLL